MIEHSWLPVEYSKEDWLPHFRNVTTGVVGSDAIAVKRTALWLGARTPALVRSHPGVFGPELRWTLGVSGSPGGFDPLNWEREYHNYAWGTTHSGASVMALLRRELRAQANRGKIPLRVVIGDLHSVNYHPDPKEAIQTVSVIAALLRDLKIPLILFETGNAAQMGSVSAANAGVLCSCLDWLYEKRAENGETSRRAALRVRLSTVWNEKEFTIPF